MKKLIILFCLIFILFSPLITKAQDIYIYNIKLENKLYFVDEIYENPAYIANLGTNKLAYGSLSENNYLILYGEYDKYANSHGLFSYRYDNTVLSGENDIRKLSYMAAKNINNLNLGFNLFALINGDHRRWLLDGGLSYSINRFNLDISFLNFELYDVTVNEHIDTIYGLAYNLKKVALGYRYYSFEKDKYKFYISFNYPNCLHTKLYTFTKKEDINTYGMDLSFNKNDYIFNISYEELKNEEPLIRVGFGKVF